jgi:hypothetical protein
VTGLERHGVGSDLGASNRLLAAVAGRLDLPTLSENLSDLIVPKITLVCQEPGMIKCELVRLTICT